MDYLQGVYTKLLTLANNVFIFLIIIDKNKVFCYTNIREVWE